MAIRDLGQRGVIDGYAEPGFGSVVDTFVAGFEERGEVGGGITVYLEGRPVVDLWGGIADPRSDRAWIADTPAVVYSCSKGILAICAYLLVQDGRLDLDAPVARYWPEFAAAGKATVTTRDLLSHRSGLSAIDAPLSRADVLAWDPVIRVLEAQRPYWEPGSDHAYHAMTYGWLVGEVIRRISGRSIGTFFRERLVEPLGLHAWLGVPLAATAEVAWLIPALPPSDPEAARLDAEAAAHPMIRSGFTMNGSLPFPGEPDDLTYNDPDVIGAEIAAAAVVTDARSLARLWAACVSEVAGTPLLSEASIEDAIVERSTGTQRYGYVDPRFRWGTGFMLDSPPVRPMLGPRSFGHDGAGGDLGFADADRRVGFGYVVNRMRGMPDERMTLLTEAVHGCLRGR